MIANTQPSSRSSLRQFFDLHYLPHCIEDPSSRNLEGYRRAIDLWEELTSNPSLAEISGLTLSQFKSALMEFPFRGRTLSINTVIKHLSHVQWVLDQAGPPGRRQLKTAAGILPQVPFTKIPKARSTYREETPTADIVRLFRVAGQHARFPRVRGLDPGKVWQALFAVQLCTSLRIGQCSQIPLAAVRWSESMVILPHEICRKSKKDEPKPLHPFALEMLEKVQPKSKSVQRQLLFPLFPKPHAKTTIYAELHRLQDLAEVEPFGFHAIRANCITSLSLSDPAAAQFAAGHSSYQTTQIYQKVRLLSEAQARLPVFRDLKAS